jgi:hypothetical protein
MTDQLPLFTAGRIARVLGRCKRSLLRTLRRVPAVGKILVQGRQFADAWSVESLPENYRADLSRLAKLKGCVNAAHLLAEGAARWQPPIPLADLAEHHIVKAGRMRSALARALSLYSDSECGENFYRVAWTDYQKEFGSVSERQVRRIMDRVIERDGGEERFEDVALYLDDKLSRAKGKETILPGLLTPSEQSVFRYLSSVRNSSIPTVDELDLVWFAACEAIHLQTEAGTPLKAARRAMVAFLEKSHVVLSKNADALKICLKRKYARYVECAGDFNQMCDARPQKSGWKRALTLDTEERNLIIGHAALQRGGRVAQAIRDLRGDGKLSPEFEAHHLANPANKSYVPDSIRKQVQPDVRRLKNMVHGPRTHRLEGAYVTRDYTASAAGDFYQADDVTLPAYYFEDTDNGPVRMRGQFLVMIDVRTDFVLGFLLVSARNYDSLAIRSLITVCSAKHGLPRRGFYFERGIWKSSKIISGDRNALPFDDTDRGLRSLGMELRHAQLPRGKVIERTIGQLQNRMEGLPGYVGRDERHDVRERVQRQFLDVDAGRSPIDEALLSKEQLCSELEKIIDHHNEEPQQGIRLNGLSPREGWERLQGDVPRQGFDAKWRYVLASDKRKIKVRSNGITLRYGKKTFVYHDAETGKRVGEEVLTWFNPMSPEVLACTDLDRKNVFTVERANPIPAMGATPEQLDEEMRKIDAHQAHAKILYRTTRNTLKAHHYVTTLADDRTVEMGAEFAEQREKITARQVERKERSHANRTLIEKQRLPRELLAKASEMPTEDVESIANFLNEPEEKK